MTHDRPILVAFDGSDHATRALHWAVATASLTHQPVLAVVVAIDPHDVVPALREYEQSFAASSAALARDVFRHAPGVEGSVVVRHGWTVPVLLAEASAAAMVVVGSHGHGVVESQWLGSVSQHLAGHVPCPVAVVRPEADPGAPTILVGVDGSPSSAAALRFACERALLTHEEVVAVHAYRAASTSPVISGPPLEAEYERVAAAERLASELVAGLATDFPDVKLRASAVQGRPARVLADLSAHASLVVVGSRGRTAFLEVLLGSVAQETLHRAACPVVVVR